MKAHFRFVFWYFHPNGKFHSQAYETWELRTIDGGTKPNMQDALAKLRGLRDSGGQEGMPGGLDEGWLGPIMIQCESGFPQLLLPR